MTTPSLTKTTTPTAAFVYGTLRRGFGNDRVLDGLDVTWTPGRASGLRMWGAHAGFPYCVVAEGYEVTGELVTASEGDWLTALARMDRLEGCRFGFPGNHYDRVVTDVTLDDGTVVQAWVYVVDRAFGDYGWVASGDWADAAPRWLTEHDEGDRYMRQDYEQRHPDCDPFVIDETGADGFAYGACACDWVGEARLSVDAATADVLAHLG